MREIGQSGSEEGGTRRGIFFPKLPLAPRKERVCSAPENGWSGDARPVRFKGLTNASPAPILPVAIREIHT